MSKTNKPDKKLSLTPNLFNSLYSMLLFFIATGKSAGVTEFSKTAAKLKAQIDRYGRFIEKENAENNLFMIYYYDRELMQIINLFNLYNHLRENPSADYFTQICADRKVKAQS